MYVVASRDLADVHIIASPLHVDQDLADVMCTRSTLNASHA